MIDHDPFRGRVAALVRRVVAPYDVEAEDAEQEVWVEFYGPDFQGRLAEVEDDERADYVAGMARQVAYRYGLAEKARREGFEAHDIYLYSTEQVRALLPVALTYWVTGALPQPPAEMRVSGGSGPDSSGNTLVTMIADLAVAVRGMSDTDKAAVWALRRQDRAVKAPDGAVDEPAAKAEAQRTARVIGRLTRRLNEWRTAPHDGVGARRAVSNATAQRGVE